MKKMFGTTFQQNPHDSIMEVQKPKSQPKQKPQYLFIVGCPRSGTTAMWELLTSSSEIVLGVERYAHRVFPPFSLKPNLFEKERFLSLKNGDTFYGNLVGFNSYYSNCPKYFPSAKYVGDKIPKLYEYFDDFIKNFPKAKIIFMFRNIFDVAASYKARAEDVNDDTWDRYSGVKKALEDWEYSIASYHQNKSKLKILPVCYESLFYKKEGLDKISSFIGIDSSELEDKYQNLLVRGNQLEGFRSRDLTVEEVFSISMKAPFWEYRKVMNIWRNFNS